MEASKITPDLLLRAYASGIFPMAEGRDDPDVFWVEPDERGILPLDAFHLSKKLRKIIRKDRFSVCINRDFRGVMAACADSAPDRPDTWISNDIERLYCDLHQRGFAHSIECWQDGRMVGGLYGIALKSAFFGESMFRRVDDASKVALAHLVARLIGSGFTLLDVQFQTDHLRQFGTLEIPDYQYRDLLAEAMKKDADFIKAGDRLSGHEVLAILDAHCSAM